MAAEICPDVARELLKHALCIASGQEQDVLAVVRAFKTFRAVNKTFRDVYEEDRVGCRLLNNYVVWVYNCTMKRKDNINRFLKMLIRSCHRSSYSRTARDAADWIVSLRASLCTDLVNYKRFIDALRRVLDAHPAETTRDGLPEGDWKLSPSHERVVAPHGTTKWAENLVFAANPGAPGRRAYAQKMVKALFRIKEEAENPYEKQAREMLECVEKMDLSNISSLLGGEMSTSL